MNKKHKYIIQLEKNGVDILDLLFKDAKTRKYSKKQLKKYLGYKPDKTQVSITNGLISCMCLMAVAPSEKSLLSAYEALGYFSKELHSVMPRDENMAKFALWTKDMAAKRLSEINNDFPIPCFDDFLYSIQNDILDEGKYLEDF